ncbi:MAG TPA: hypothetical protein P5050_02320 [Bacteroidia bacterium]|nr:hypothetical protein [Bacteroidia bacterium]HRS58037.1 hypothetical protein [Bacteroidia bacterium]HRU68862.1 hypothetical protein [Bacteroidia bacterium]
MKQLLLISAFLSGISIHAFSQCCSAGNPVGGDATMGLFSKNQWIINIGYKHSASDQYFHLSRKADMNIVDESFFDYNQISVNYGISKRLAVFAETGYFWDKTQKLTFDSSEIKIQSHGLGDLQINLRYKIIKSANPRHQLIFSGGIKLPVGAFNEEQDGIVVPVSLQPSSGALKYNVSFFYSSKKPDKKLGLSCFTLFEASRWIEKDFLIHHYGPYLQLTPGFNYSLKKILISAYIKYELRGKDQRENNSIIESSGSQILLFNPSIRFSISGDWSFSLSTDLPIFKYVYGYQLTNKYAIQFGIRKEINRAYSVKVKD